MRIPGFCHCWTDRSWSTFEEILEGYPDIEREDIQAADAKYAAWVGPGAGL